MFVFLLFVFMHVWLYAVCVLVPPEARIVVWSPGAVVAGGCELSDRGSGNQNVSPGRAIGTLLNL